ncbi:hypothetical protein BJV82DRAFT_552135 [Fennellomyces sp. T-0311]|nr:hypothetical protein BJV82DRAFT_552135 [Fennellomyces sp. T-0311]
MVQSTPESTHIQDQPRLLRRRRSKTSMPASRQQPSRSAKTAASAAVASNGAMLKPARKRRSTRSFTEESNGTHEAPVQRKRHHNARVSNQSKHTAITQKPKPYRVGDQIEALKWENDETRQWYCARVVTEVDERPRADESVDAADGTAFFVHYEGWTADHADWVDASSIRPLPKDREVRQQLRYGPRGKESDSSWADYRTFYYSKEAISLVKHHTGLVQDQRMAWHDCPCHSREHIHPERPERINAILKALYTDRLLRYFCRVRGRQVTVQELLRVHSLLHVSSYCPANSISVENVTDNLMTESNPRATSVTSIRDLLNQPTSETPSPSCSPPPQDSTAARAQGVEGGKVVKADKNQIRQQRRRFSSAAASQAALNGNAALVNPPRLVYEMACKELAIEVDTPFHPLYTSISARVAAGSLIELADQVVEGSLHNGFALIRPPGHHAEDDRAMGFCFFNNVAVAVAAILETHSDTIKKVLIIDCHGNGTEKIFYKNPNVLYISLHRWENGMFYPRSGAPDQCGEETGEGRNVNIAFNTSKEKPSRSFIFVSAGFDAAEGHPDNIGGYQVTPKGFAMLTKLTKDLAEEICGGRLVLSLEGGYELEPLANSAAASVAQLLPAELVPDVQLKYDGSLSGIKPNLGAVQSLRTVAEIQRKYWDLPDELTQPTFRFLLPVEWRAKDSISIRPKRAAKPIKIAAVEGY